MKRILIFVLFLISSLSTSVWALDDVRCGELLPKGLVFAKDCQSIRGNGKLNLYTLPARTPSGLVNALVTMPAGTNAKWVVDTATGTLMVETASLGIVIGGGTAPLRPVVINYLGQVANYGIVPNSLSPYDGRPLDILVLGGPMLRGSVTPVKLIGAIQVEAFGSTTVKLLAVLPGTYLGDNVNDLDGLDAVAPGVKTIVQTWLENASAQGVPSTATILDLGTAYAVLDASAPNVVVLGN
jgi:inorganic pyrophosphatase